MNSSERRAELERLIVDNAKRIIANQETGCINETDLQQYLETWHQLVLHYRHSDEMVIAVEAVRDYLQSMDYFFGISNYQTFDETCRERATEALQELDASMKYIIQAVELKLPPT
jgi:hypothetical protein